MVFCVILKDLKMILYEETSKIILYKRLLTIILINI